MRSHLGGINRGLGIRTGGGDDLMGHWSPQSVQLLRECLLSLLNRTEELARIEGWRPLRL